MLTSTKKGFGFGLTSGITTTLGLIVGLDSGTHSKAVVIGGILVIAIADALSDALGIHISEESENHHTTREIWNSTLYTFISKFFFALSFLVPVVFLPLSTAIIVSIIWGLSLIGLFSYFISRNHANPLHVITEHVTIAIIVIVATYYIGNFISTLTAV